MHSYSNSLIDETSPYLLQHAHNPVDWMPWGDEAFEKAKGENKLVIISIGYSACHWCHVMERETFEDSIAAALMNAKYVSVKVDREERPDVDQVYMTSVQLMTGRGGWPLNVVTLPDGRPVWGGTYFPKKDWMKALESIANIYKDEPEKILEYAEKLMAGIKQSELVQVNPEPPSFDREEAQAILLNWQQNFDTQMGGSGSAPKFPLPNNYEYLLYYGHLSGDESALDQTRLTLQKMAYGGIYDQIGGGFARYSTDEYWKAPHFEKMLYDNAQLVSLYSKAYQKFKDPLYKAIVFETLEWVKREMTGPAGEFYSALDADSEGEEGKFYVWKKEELKNIIPEGEWDLFSSYYDLKIGVWEHNNIILLRRENDKIANPAPSEIIENWKKILMEERANRIRPGLDDKSLSSWNALMITAYLDAYTTFKKEEYLDAALKNARWIEKNQIQDDGSLLHTYNKGKSKINGLLEDYAFAISAYISLFETTFEERYLVQASEWTQFVKSNFEDSATGLFYMRNLNSRQLISKSLETTDNVIPASNSVMANNLFLLSHYLDKQEYRDQSEKMLNQVKDKLIQYGGSFSNWGQLMLNFTYPYYEVAIAGTDAQKSYMEFKDHYIPNALFIASQKESKNPLLESRFVKGVTRIYVCQNRVCKLPVESVDKALPLLK